MTDTSAHIVKIVLERIEVLDDLDPFWCGPGEIRFTASVTPGKALGRQVTTRFPTVGVYRMHRGSQVIEREIFAGPVETGEDLTLKIAGVEEDLFTRDDAFPTYHRVFEGDPVAWAGRYGPDDDAADPETLATWRLWFRIEVSAGADIPARDLSWGPNHIDAILRDERRDRDGKFDPAIWTKARRHRGQMVEPHPLDDAPTGVDFDAKTRASAVLNGKPLGVAPVENPMPVATPGFTGRVLSVSAEGEFGGDADLALQLDLKEMAGIDPGSIRVFRWDKRRDRFVGVQRSGMSRDGKFAWAKINRPGIYGAFGLPADPARRSTLQVIRSATGWDQALRGGGLAHQFIDPICKFILCAGDLRDLTQNPEALRKLGLEYQYGVDPRDMGAFPVDGKGRPFGPRPGPPGGPGGQGLPDIPRGGNICDQCLELGRLPGGFNDLPELELLDGVFTYPGWVFPFRPQCTQWDSIGPTNLGGRVQSLAWHPTDSNIVYAGNSQGGVYRSSNGGTTWRAMMSGELTLAIGAVAVAPSDPATVYAGTGEYNGNRYQSGVGIYLSTNGGADWDLTRGASLNSRYSRIVVHPTNAQIVYASGTAGVERSMDGGASWTLILAGACSDLVMDPNDPDTLYAGMEDARGVQTTSDARAATPVWTAMNNNLTLTRDHSTNPAQNYIKLAAGNDSGTTVLWLQINGLPDPWTGGDPPGRGDYKLDVYRWDGANWQLRRTRNDISYFNWCSVIACESTDPDVVYAGGIGLEWSPDGGATWHGLGAGHADQHAIAFDPNDADRTIIGNDGGLYSHTRTAGQTTWNYAAINADHVTIQFLNVAVSETGAFRVAGSTQDQGILVNDHIGTDYDGMGGSEWGPVDVFAGDGRIIMWDPHNDRAPVLQRSDDGGATRRNADNGLGGRWVNEIAIHPTDADIVLVATPAQGGNDAAIYRSTDAGAPAPATGFVEVETFMSTVSDITFAPGAPSRVYAAVGTQIWASDDGGINWQQLAAGPLWPAIASVTVDWSDENLIYITYRNAGVRHVHLGEVDLAASVITWRDISGRAPFSSLPDVPAHRLIVDLFASERLYVATDIGVFRSFDGGDWWYPFDDGLPNALVNDLAMRRTGHRLYVSTFGRGFYSRPI